MSALVYVHILFGSLAIVSGFATPFTKKGFNAHKRLGQLFWISILVLGLTAAFVAWVRGIPLSFLNGLLICYLVVTALNVIKQPAGRTNLVDRSMAAVAGSLTLGYCHFAIEAANAPDGILGGFSSLAYIAFGIVALICAGSDLRLLLSGGVSGKHRIIRHLWRMFFPLFLATAAFFLGQARFFPESMQHMGLLLLPVVGAFGGMIVWIAIVALGNRYRLVMKP